MYPREPIAERADIVLQLNAAENKIDWPTRMRETGFIGT